MCIHPKICEVRRAHATVALIFDVCKWELALAATHIHTYTQKGKGCKRVPLFSNGIEERFVTAGMASNDMANKYECIEKCLKCISAPFALHIICWGQARFHCIALHCDGQVMEWIEKNETAEQLRVITVVTAIHETRWDETNWLNGGYHSDTEPLSAWGKYWKWRMIYYWNFCLRC